jgi:hypothetical protein
MSDVLCSELHAMKLREPWRNGMGQSPSTDTTWRGHTPELCRGEIEWEDGTGWWTCTGCGFIGSGPTQMHFPVDRPLPLLLDSMVYYFDRRAQQGASFMSSLRQMLFVSAMAIRYSATLPPEELEAYANRLVTRQPVSAL